MIRAWRVAGGLALASMLLVAVPCAQASHPPPKRLADGVQRIVYTVGPLSVTPGQNRISYKPITGADKPSVDGWITRLKPNLVRADGSIPSTEKVMFHHGVWLNLSNPDATSGLPERFYGVGEEKTIMQLPEGFGYRYDSSDFWVLNHMIHNLTPQAMTLYIRYTIDFIPDGSPAADGIRPVRPIWMDVQNGSFYPVFDVHRGSGGKDGEFVYPDDDPNAYQPGVHKNRWTVHRDGVLVSTAGHVHTGGLETDLYLRRSGARYAGPRCKNRSKAATRRRCRNQAPSVRGNRAHLFRSDANYFEPAGPVSWDVSMKATRPNWRVAVKAGDTLETTTTYETKIGSWYESMGIMVVYMADGAGGKDPYKTKVDYPGQVTHGHLPENNVHGGKPTDLPDPRNLPSGAATGDPFLISGFTYAAGDYRIPGAAGRPPVVKRGQSLAFELAAGDASKEIWHSLTSCKAPCNRSTGIAYPIADGKFEFDSGQLGDVTPAMGTRVYETPKTLPVGTYTYFCRIHPLMRGAFRVTN